MRNDRNVIALVILAAMIFLPAAGAAQGTLFVEGDNVGVGTPTPSVPLHVLRNSSSDTTEFRLENSGGNRFDFLNTHPTGGGHWQFINTSNPGGADLVIRELLANTSEEFRLTEAGNLTISGTLFQNSSRDTKLGIRSVDAAAVLEQVINLPIAEWSYRNDSPSIKHVGPMAEDFFASFGLGGTSKAISPLDTSGIALAAIQGLHGTVTARDQQIAGLLAKQEQLEARNEELEARLRALETALMDQD